MKSVEHVKYLGDEESNVGRNDTNIEKRCTKFIGIKSQIILLVKEISLGSHYFDIGLLIRDTNLINGILFNSEVWYGLLQKHVEKLEKLDELLLRSLLDAHSKTAIEALYLETGKMPIRFLIQKITQSLIADAPVNRDFNYDEIWRRRPFCWVAGQTKPWPVWAQGLVWPATKQNGRCRQISP